MDDDEVINADENLNEVAVALERIERENGGVLEPRTVWMSARSESHPLHRKFTWNDTKAADKWRDEEARRLIRAVYRRVVCPDNVIRVVPKYQRDPRLPASDPGYVRLDSLRSEKSIALAALLQDLERVASSLRRARSVAAGLGLDGELDGLLHSVELMKDAAAQRDFGREQPIQPTLKGH